MSLTQILGIANVWSQLGSFGTTPSSLGWMSPIYRLCRLAICKALLQIPGCRFTTLTQSWSIDFPGINTIGHAESIFCQLAQPHVECFYLASYDFRARCVQLNVRIGIKSDANFELEFMTGWLNGKMNRWTVRELKKLVGDHSFENWLTVGGRWPAARLRKYIFETNLSISCENNLSTKRGPPRM